jgi:acyl carrier protein
MITNIDIEKKVVSIVSDQSAIPTETILLESSFKDDLGGDSLDEVELMMQLEEDFKITIPDDESLEIQTIGEIIDFVQSTLAESC